VSNRVLVGSVIMQRLHRMVRHGFRPWLGYSAESGQDKSIHLRRRGVYPGREQVGEDVADISPNGSVWFVFKVPLAHSRADSEGNLHSEAHTIFADDSENFDALFPAEAPFPRRGRLVRWLYDSWY
jgi:hypothetical protein